MAIMMNCAQDWTYDMFLEDVKIYTALPIKGVHCRANASWRERFMRDLKTFARDFEEKWLEEHDGHRYDRYDGWIGDAFGFQHGEDTSRTFCANPVRDAVRNAQYVREVLAQ